MSCLAVVDVNNSFTHIHNPLLLLIQIKGGMGRDMHASSSHIDHATIAQFRQWDFVDQTQHVKNAFYLMHADPRGMGKQDRAEELSKDQQHAMSEDIIDPFEV